jgi:hypothetical protein
VAKKGLEWRFIKERGGASAAAGSRVAGRSLARPGGARC